MTDQTLAIQTPASHAGVLRVEFPRIEDRYHHRIFLVQDDKPQLLLTSEEGTPEDYWPSSPPLQQLSIEDRGDLQVALAVGMAGSSHWSMSVETCLSRLVFEIACRYREDPQQLGTTYTVAPEATGLFEIAPATIQRQDGGLQAEIETSGDQIKIAAPQASGTAQWKYTVTFAGAPS